MKKLRIPALLACVLLCLAMALSLSYIVMESGHHCDGEQCEICEEIARYEALLTKLAVACIALALLFHSLRRAAGPVHRFGLKLVCATPVRMKVKLLN